MKAIHQNIRDHRKELKLTQTELAQRLGYADKSMIAKIEKGLVNLPQDRIEAFAQALGTTPADLAGWTEEKKAAGLPRYLEQQMEACGWIVVSVSDGTVTLAHNGERYEIAMESIKELEDRTAGYLDSLFHDLAKAARKTKGSNHG